MSDDQFLIEIQNDFLHEASDSIAMLEEEFLNLEKAGTFGPNLDKVMRVYHNLKGSAMAVGFEELSRFCHTIENLLVVTRLDEILLGRRIVDIMLRSNDKLKKCIDLLKANPANALPVGEVIIEVNELIDDLKKPHEIRLKLDLGILPEYLNDVTEQLEVLDAALIQLEKDQESTEAVHLLFRAFHTLKSSSGIIGFSPIEDLTHELESLITPAREGTSGLTPGLIALCLDAVGIIRNAIQELRVTNEASQEVLKPFIGLIKRARELSDAVAGSNNNEEDAILKNHTASIEVSEIRSLKYQRDSSVSSSQETQGGTETNKDNGESIAPRPLTVHKELLKVDPDRMDKLIDIIGELVIAEAMVFQASELRNSTQNENLLKKINQLNKVTRQLHEVGLSLRMVPIRPTFKKMQRIVRDVSKKLGKDIDFSISGEETELDKTVVEKIGDPLIHMVRNAIDHGIEKNGNDRIAAGKPVQGKLTLKAFHKGGSVWIEIQDDGRGMNKNNLINKAIDKGLITSAENLSEREIYNLIFLPGFSTAEQVTDVSGRGVGMDVVKKNVEDIHGHIEIRSEEGKGTTFSIRIPNTLAIIDGMVIYVGSERYVIPTQSIIRSITLNDAGIFTVMGERGEVMNLGDESIPLMRLGRYLGTDTDDTADSKGLVLLVEEDGKKLGLLINQISRQQQFVTKPLEGVVRDVYGFAGGTIMSDGQVGLIVDVGALIKDVENGNYLRVEQEINEKLMNVDNERTNHGASKWLANA